jgi:hypothetical protein
MPEVVEELQQVAGTRDSVSMDLTPQPLLALGRLQECNAGVRFLSVPRLHDADTQSCSWTAFSHYGDGGHWVQASGKYAVCQQYGK